MTCLTGHGGSRAAEYLKEHLFENLMKHPQFITDTKLAISAFKFSDTPFLCITPCERAGLYKCAYPLLLVFWCRIPCSWKCLVTILILTGWSKWLCLFSNTTGSQGVGSCMECWCRTECFSTFWYGFVLFYLVTWVSLQVKRINRLMLIFWILKERHSGMMVLPRQQRCWLVTIYMLPMLEIQGQ